jgi:hypothetical protein
MICMQMHTYRYRRSDFGPNSNIIGRVVVQIVRTRVSGSSRQFPLFPVARMQSSAARLVGHQGHRHIGAAVTSIGVKNANYENEC